MNQISSPPRPAPAAAGLPVDQQRREALELLETARAALFAASRLLGRSTTAGMVEDLWYAAGTARDAALAGIGLTPAQWLASWVEAERSGSGHGYSLLTHHPGGFKPFEPDAVGALREAYAWISQPAVSTPARLCYPAAGYDALTAMLRRALRTVGSKAGTED